MDQPRPWTLIGGRTLDDHRVFRTRALEVADPRTGKIYPRSVLDAADWVNVVPLTTRGEVVLVRQFRFGSWANSLEIPGGMLDPGEAPEGAAARELEEETGFRPGRLERLGSTHPNPALFSNRLHSYLALDCERVHQGAPEAAEDLQVVVVSQDELKNLVRRGEVTHALVLAALLLDAWR